MEEIALARSRLMEAQHQVVRRVKALLLKAAPAPRQIRFGIGAGIWFMLDRRSNMQQELGLYESEVQGVYRRHIRPESVVYDIGAANGDTALIFARLASRGRVVAFEPDRQVYDACRRNLALNPSLQDRIRLVPSRVATGETSLDTYIWRDQRGPVPDFVKIDVDGGEFAVLQGMASTIRARHPTMLIEVHSSDLETKCLAYLRLAGYVTRVIKNARWRGLYPEYRPGKLNRWLLARAA